jgi:hypothetical protein
MISRRGTQGHGLVPGDDQEARSVAEILTRSLG